MLITRLKALGILCAARSSVKRFFNDYSTPNDCFCENPDEGGLRPGHDAEGNYRSDGRCEQYVSDAVNYCLARGIEFGYWDNDDE